MIQIHLYTKQTHRYRKHSYGYQRTGGKDKSDFEINGHILPNIKQQGPTWSCIQYLVKRKCTMEKNLKKKFIYI